MKINTKEKTYMKTSIIGYPRIGRLRELKFLTEKYFRKEISETELLDGAKALRKENLAFVADEKLDFIPSNDFSFYDNVLDAAALLNIIPARYRALGLGETDTYFAMARGYQGEKGDVTALPMKKWFNTNYHYIVPEIEDDAEIKLVGTKIFDEFAEAQASGISTTPVIVGPYTLLSLADFGTKKAADFAAEAISAYKKIISRLAKLGTEWIQIDEPFLITDLTAESKALFSQIYSELLKNKNGVKILLQTYFGDIRDIYSDAVSLDFDAIGLDFLEGLKTLELIKKNGFPKDKLLFAGILNGKNIWRNNYAKTLALLDEIKSAVPAENIVINTSCSLLHVPYSVKQEDALSDEYKAQLAFAEEKLDELNDLKLLAADGDYKNNEIYKSNERLLSLRKAFEKPEVQAKIAALTDKDFTRLPAFAEREKIQRQALNLPLFPTTTIGSFPQTAEVKANRAKFKRGEISAAEYENNVKAKIAEWIKIQEEIGIDVLVHGEFERNDMVEHFGEHLDGYIFTKFAWVQSYGTRCVKPPIVWSDISRSESITVAYSKYAQSLTKKPVKGMLTGPVTILNWSFPREDISHKEMALQIGLAIKEEVLELEANGIRVIQIDEAALKEKLPIRREDWHKEYLDWAIPAFRLVHSTVKPETQIHTHMCYSEFIDIIRDIDDMDADVISFEASRSNLEIIDALKEASFKTQVGPGVYDIHSPRIPSEDEIYNALKKMLSGERILASKLWVNPDCGLKTRGEKETIPSLTNLVNAARRLRKEYADK